MRELVQQLSQLIAENLQASPTATVEQLVERLITDDRIIQINTGNALAFQTFVDQGGTANVGIHLHDFDDEKLNRVLKAFWQSLQPTGVPNNVPRSGVAKFIGRKLELEQLHTQLQQGNLVSISAIEGMGGVGKTELAIQYAKRYASDYKGGIVWLFAREFNIGAQVVKFAQSQLNLKMPEELDLLDQVVFCWRNWCEGEVLLILDDVINYSRDVEPYLPPPAFNRFKIVLTTRLMFGPPIQSLSLDVLLPEQSLELLVGLIGESRVQQELDSAKSLCVWLGHLPLGIELVSRYLLKRTELSLSTLLIRLQEKAKKRQVLKHDALQRDESTGTSTARRGVEAAFDLSWDDMNAPDQHVGKLLSLFASAPIPWHLVESVEQKYCEIWEESKEFDVEKFEQSRTKLLDLHLLQLSQQKEQIYRLHSLICEFFRGKLDQERRLQIVTSTEREAEQLKQAFAEVMVEVAKQIPDFPTLNEVAALDSAIPHLQMLATDILSLSSDEIFTEDANLVWIFTGLGRFYDGQGFYWEAEPWYKGAIAVTEARLGSEHLDVATSLNNLATLYHAQGRYKEIESLLLRSISIQESQLGKDHPDVARGLNNLAELYLTQGQYDKAEEPLTRSLSIREIQLGKDHPEVAVSLHNLAGLYVDQRRYDEAEQLYLRARSIWESRLGKDHPYVATSLNGLAELYRVQGRYEEAEQLHLRAKSIRETQLDKNHPDIAVTFNNLAELYHDEKRYEEAEPLLLQAIEIGETQLGKDHPAVAHSLNNLANLYHDKGCYKEAEPLYLRALSICESQLGKKHPYVARCLGNLANLYHKEERYREAEQLYLKSLSIIETQLGKDHPNMVGTLNNLAKLYYDEKRYGEAELLYKRALAIAESHLEASHPDTITIRKNLEKLGLEQKFY